MLWWWCCDIVNFDTILRLHPPFYSRRLVQSLTSIFPNVTITTPPPTHTHTPNPEKHIHMHRQTQDYNGATVRPNVMPESIINVSILFSLAQGKVVSGCRCVTARCMHNIYLHAYVVSVQCVCSHKC